MIGVDVVDVQVRRRGGRLSRRRHGVEGNPGSTGESGDRLAAIADKMIARRDNSGEGEAHRSAVDLGQDRVEGGAVPVAGDEDGNVVLVKARMPGRSAAPSRLSRQVGPSALEGFENEGFVRFDDSSQAPGLVACRGAQKPMTPTKRRRRMDSAERRGLGQALALDHRARVIEPAVLLAQMRHRRLGQRIEGAPAALAAKPQKPMRAAPANDFAASAMGTPLSRHALDAGRSERVLLAPALAALLGGSCSRAPNHARLLKRNHRLPALVLAHPRNRRQPSRKIFNLHRIALPIRTTLTKSTTNAIRALLSALIALSVDKV